jgi:hypothetical protein
MEEDDDDDKDTLFHCLVGKYGENVNIAKFVVCRSIV